MIRWMKRISPCLEVALLGGTVVPLMLFVGYGIWLLIPDKQPFDIIQWLVACAYCVFGGIYYGSCRVTRFHPHANEGVRIWLATTPWRWPQPLPFGPVKLVPQDAIAVLLATAWTMVVTGSLWPLALFVAVALTTYVCGLSSIASATNVQGVGFGVGFTLAAAFAFAVTPWLSGAFLVACYLIVRWGNEQSLRRFHEWTDQLDTEDRVPADWTWTGKNAKGTLGWPYATISPQRSKPLLPMRKAIEASLLMGIWTWALFHLGASVIEITPVEQYDFSVVKLPLLLLFYRLPALLGGVLAVGRGMCYCSCLTPPLSLWGRVKHRRLILPGYDSVLIVSLMLAVLGGAMSLMGEAFAVPHEAFLPFCVTSLAFLSMAAKPTFEEWRLTADGHIQPRNMSHHRDLMETQ